MNQLRTDLRAAIQRRGWHAMIQERGKVKARFFSLGFIEATDTGWRVWTFSDGHSQHELAELHVALDRIEASLRSLIKEAKTSLGER